MKIGEEIGRLELKEEELKQKELKEKELRERAKEHCFKLKEMYRIANSFILLKVVEKEEEDKERKNYIDLVIDRYYELYNKNINKEKSCVLDVSAMHFMRDMGILDDQDDILKSKLLDVFRRIDIEKIKVKEEIYTKLYREVFADLLMVTSLNMDSFGYCRQVLQTISDARIDELEYDYIDIDNERFRIVTAVLLSEELKLSLDRSSTDYIDSGKHISINAKNVIEKGKSYCQYTLNCIYDKFMEKEIIKYDDNKKKLVADLLNNIYAEMVTYFEDLGIDNSYECTILNAIIHGKEAVIEEVAEKFSRFEEIIDEAQEFKYIFWRIECFCLGIEYILQGSYVKVPKSIWGHMCEIRKKIKKEKGKGCIWEKENADLLLVKDDVGNFYNIPELVYKKASREKLENTIEFIQNFYYHNRFRMMQMKDDL